MRSSIKALSRCLSWPANRNKRDEGAHAEIDRRFQAATGLTREEWREIDHNDPRWKELLAVNNKIYADFPMFADEDPESNWICDER